MQPNIKISPENLKEVSALLNTLLADEYVLYTKTRSAHWNIEASNFMELHKFFQEQYEELDEIIDEVAERMRMLGHYPIGSLKGYLNVSHLLESNTEFRGQKDMVQALLNDHETIIGIIRNDIAPISDKYKDLGTTDFVTGIMQQHEKMAWMLRAML